jgi:transposase
MVRMVLNRAKMPQPYSTDLREKLYAQLDSGMSITNASKIFRINRQTIYNWVSIKEETGKLEAKSGYQKGHSHKIKNLEQLENFIRENPDKTLKELSELWPEKISGWTIGRWIKRLGYTYKKNLFSYQKR